MQGENSFFSLHNVERKLKRKEVDNWWSATTASPVFRNCLLSLLNYLQSVLNEQTVIILDSFIWTCLKTSGFKVFLLGWSVAKYIENEVRTLFISVSLVKN